MASSFGKRSIQSGHAAKPVRKLPSEPLPEAPRIPVIDVSFERTREPRDTFLERSQTPEISSKRFTSLYTLAAALAIAIPGMIGVYHTAIGITPSAAVASANAAPTTTTPTPAADDGLIPQAEFPQNGDVGGDETENLVQKYPQDPRAHLWRASYLASHRDIAGAERELRQGLNVNASLHESFAPKLDSDIRMSLATLLTLEGRTDDAKAFGSNACQASSSDPDLWQMRQALRLRGLCP